MTPLDELIRQIDAIHQADIPGFADAQCIECATSWPCDTAQLLGEWKAAAS